MIAQQSGQSAFCSLAVVGMQRGAKCTQLRSLQAAKTTGILERVDDKCHARCKDSGFHEKACRGSTISVQNSGYRNGALKCHLLQC